MSPVAQLDHELEAVILEFVRKIVVPKMSEFDDVWDIANRVCDNYEIAKAA
jgi:hypothetical protein